MTVITSVISETDWDTSNGICRIKNIKKHVLLYVMKKVITVLEVQKFCHLDVIACSLADIINISREPTASIIYLMREAAMSS